jgi:cysteine desulfurase
MKSDLPEVYLDHAASTPPFDAVVEQYPQWLRSTYANSGAAHTAAYDNRRSIEAASVATADLADAPEAEVIWTSGGTESNNLALRGVLADTPNRGLLISATEHASVRETATALEASGTAVTDIPVSASGQLDLDELAARLSPTTGLVSICAVQNETGVIQDLAAVRAVMHDLSPKALLHVDGVQAFGKVPIDWHGAGIDLLTLAGHKIHGPPGVGCLICRKGVRLRPILHGGGQQRNRRSGTPDVCGILAFSAAAKQLINEQDAAVSSARELQAQTLGGVRQIAEANNIDAVIFGDDRVSPFILSFSFPGYQGAVLARLLSARGVHVGTGSACAAESKEPSKVLTAMGVSRDTAFGTIRISFGYTSSTNDVERFLAEFAEVVKEY